MKIALVIAVLLTINCSAQNIDGIGQIKIGKTYNQVLQDIGIEPKKIKSDEKDGPFSFSDVYRPSKPTLLRYNPAKPNKDVDYLYTKCTSVSTLLLPSYTVAGIEVKDLTLLFNNDTLYQIQINTVTAELTKAFELKYGEGKLDRTVKKVTCTSAIVKSYEVEEVKFERNWENVEEGIYASYVLSDYRDSKCKQSYLSFIHITKNKTQKVVTSCASSQRESDKKKADEELKSKLKDF